MPDLINNSTDIEGVLAIEIEEVREKSMIKNVSSSFFIVFILYKVTLILQSLNGLIS